MYSQEDIVEDIEDIDDGSETPIPRDKIKLIRIFINDSIKKFEPITVTDLLNKISEFEKTPDDIDSNGEVESDEEEEIESTDSEESENSDDEISEDMLKFIKNILKSALRREFILTFENLEVIIKNI
jgi:hypothetical protein